MNCWKAGELPGQFRDPRQVMIVMVCDKEEKVHRSHRRPEPRVQRVFEYRLFIDGLQQVHRRRSYLPEPRQQFFQRPVIVPGLRRERVLQVGGAQLFSSFDNIVQPPLPQRLQIAEMPKIFFDGPAAIRLNCQQRRID